MNVDVSGDRADHERLARTGFADGSSYHFARPDYPDAALTAACRALALTQESRAVDLGAGTGILTRQLLKRFCWVTAIEPSPGMRDTLAAAVHGARVLDGRDTALPLPDRSCEVVYVAQAGQWVDAPRALREIARVLIPGGGLVVMWNNRDESVGWVAEFSRAMRWDRQRPYSPETDYAAVLSAEPFGEVTHRRFAHTQTVTRDQLVQRVLSTSYVSAMPEFERGRLVADVRGMVASLAEPIVFPYVTDVYWCSASGARAEMV
jgi:SAM-dependent methyltransferase